MKFPEVAELVRQIPKPHVPIGRGRVLYRHIRRTKPENVLELGTARGASALFIAGALEANGKGHLTTVDSRGYAWTDPSPEEVIGNAGLAHRVTLDRSYSTYTWFLKERLEACSDPDGVVHPEWDLVFLDGSKSWSTDGLAVLLIEKLLRPGGWLLLDDLTWTYEEGPIKRGKTTHYDVDLTALSEPERIEPHLLKIYELLIKRNPAFTNFRIEDDWWGWAQKVKPKPARPRRGRLARLAAAAGSDLRN